MGLAFGATRQFEKDLKRLSKRYRLLFNDLEPILDSIKKGECIGTLLTEANCFKALKVRFANTTINKGKSSGFRLIYAHFEGEQYDAAIALSLYCKQDVDNISDQELARLILEAHVVLANMAPPVFKAQEVKQQP
jgi:mRNA-degrading endonuclease RelE of RelBE toxin-antitoxin system